MTPRAHGAPSAMAEPIRQRQRIGLAKPLATERSCEIDRGLMVAALRVALRLPRALPTSEGR